MALNFGELLAAPTGGRTGGVKAGTNISIAADGTISATPGGAVGTITSVIAGAGLTGGGASGSVTLDVGAGVGIAVGADSISLNNTGVTAGSYTAATITVDAQGRITAASTTAVSSFPAGTLLSFPQAVAPTGWSQIATFDNASIRLVGGSGGGATGGTIGFSTLFSPTATYSGSINITSGSVGDTTLSEAQLGSHTHSAERFQETGSGLRGGGSGTIYSNVGTPTGAAGGNAVHTHSLAGAAAVGNFVSNFDLLYVNYITCSKN
jgi:hypothetical protein